MAEAMTVTGKPTGTDKRVPTKSKPIRKRRDRSLKIDRPAVVKWIVEQHEKVLQDRSGLDDKRMERHAKLDGVLLPKTWPWENCANFSVPLMLLMSLRMVATIENAAKSSRPLLQSKAQQRRNHGKQERIDQILDYQFFIENHGENIIDGFAQNFVNDEAAYVFSHWVKEDHTVVSSKAIPASVAVQIQSPEDAFSAVGLDGVVDFRQADEDGFSFSVDYIDGDLQRTATVEVFDVGTKGDLRIELYQTVTAYDGPVPEVMDFEDVIFPVRSGNLQPPSGANPHGAPWVNRIFKTSKDTIRRNMKSGMYDLLTEKDWEDIESATSPEGSGDEHQEPKEQRDALAGTQVTTSSASMMDLRGIEHYGAFAMNGKGLEEQVILTVIWDRGNKGWLARARFLSEAHPGIPIRRPINSASFIPNTNRVIGKSFPQLLEQLQDAMQVLLNQHIDWGTITNTPMFFDKPNSSMKAEPIYIEPGMGYPLEDPRADINTLNWPQRDSAYAINMVTILNQFAERISMMSDVQFGRVPTGKASALRTMGTTLSLLAQGDARSEQVLRRYLQTFSWTFHDMHEMNRRFLPDQKEFRIFGYVGSAEDAYAVVSPGDVDAGADFEFKATLLNTNKQVIGQNIQTMIALVVSPLAVQAGLVTEEQMYNLFQDLAKVLDLPDDRYVNRPPNVSTEQKFTAKEAISIILSGEVPKGMPAESAAEHMELLRRFAQSEEIGVFNEFQNKIFMFWFNKMLLLVNQEATQRQKLAEIAAQQQGGGGSEGPGGEETEIRDPNLDPPEVQGSGLLDESLGE